LFASNTNTSQSVGDLLIANNFGLTKEEINKLLLIALSKGGDFSELYFEYIRNNSVMMEEGLIKSSSEYISLGVGIRVIKGNNFGYAHSNELTFEQISKAALTAATIATGNNKVNNININEAKANKNVYDMGSPVVDVKLTDKIALIKSAHDTALKYNSKITKVSASLVDEMQYITIANSDGLLISDVRPQTRFNVSATATDGDNRGTGGANAGGRVGFDFYKKDAKPEELGTLAAEEAYLLLQAKNAPAGEMPVVLSRHKSGVMIHEAVGHPFEADFI
jgi:TldD protein